MSRNGSLRQSLRKTRASFLNLFGKNDKRRWDRSYAEGHWTFLDSAEQRPRHHVIGGMLRTLSAEGASVLDVGCGTGALVPHLPDNVARYVGIDLSSEAIRICREKEDSSGSRTFMATSFDDYVPSERFDAVVFNEMLYYYPVRRVPEVLARARALLRTGSGTIIVSIHNKSLKRYHVWNRMRRWMTSAETVEAMDPLTGNSWRIKRYAVRAGPRNPAQA